MLSDDSWRFRMTDSDVAMYRAILPSDHPLIDALELIPWQSLESVLEGFYCEDRGQPAFRPVFLLKMEFLRYKYNLSDRQVFDRARTDILFRWFLQIPIRFHFPDFTLLTKFRGRLGAEGFKTVFDQLVGFARTAGLVKDRLRLKDASHVIANIAVPTTLKLFGQLRDRLLTQMAKFDKDAAQGYQILADQIREQTLGQNSDARLEPRVTLLQDILYTIRQFAEPPDANTNSSWQELQRLCQLAEQILDDQAHPERGRRTLSLVDSQARRGKHGDWYDGYVLDVLMDADSELITALDVLEAGGDEAKNAIALVRAEQDAHGHQIEQLSIDGAGFNGVMLRELEDPEGLNVTVFVPPKSQPENDLFPPSAFRISESGDSVTCPAGQTSSYRQADKRGNGWIFRFTRSQCDGCPLVTQCKSKPQSGAFGRSVTKSDYETEYQRARQRATTAEYRAVRKEHPAIERKLNDILNHHGGRFARYWGHEKVRAQEFMTGFTANAKQIIKLLTAKPRAALI